MTKIETAKQEYTDWCEAIGITSLADINSALEAGMGIPFINLCEARQERKYAEVADQIFFKRKKCRIVMMSGPSSSGKTSSSLRIAQQCRVLGLSPKVIELDNYFVDRELTPKDENGEYDYEHLHAMNIDRLNSDLLDLLDGKEVELPRFNFKEGKSEQSGQKMMLADNDVLFMEGIHALNPELTPRIDQKRIFHVYISALSALSGGEKVHNSTTDKRLLRRIVRDNRVRGISPEDTILRWPSVRRGETRNIFPYEENADLDPHSPLLQLFCSAANQVTTLRTSAFAQRELKFFSRHDHQFKFVAGIRGQYYRQFFDHLSTPAADTTSPNHQFLLSPRISLNLKPNWDSADMLFRLAGGVYQQAPFYREMRYIGGGLNTRIQAQTSYQATASLDWNFHLSDMPFKFTADIYYKYITHLIPYTIDNMRLRYDAHNNAVAYAAGISLRLNGELLPGLESWASLSLMQTQEDILGDNLGWIRRPTDQRFSFKMFFQDNLPSMPWWKMSLNFLFGSRLPVTFPYQQDRSAEFHLPSYFRVDWGNTVCFSQIKAFQHSKLFRFFDDIQLGIEVFNLFNYHNVISFIWVADYENTYYPVPNYLTARQVNLKLTLVF